MNNEYPRFCAPRNGRGSAHSQVEMLCTLGAVFQHGAHGGVAVDICVFALDIAVGCILVGDVLEGFHQSVVHVSDSGIRSAR